MKAVHRCKETNRGDRCRKERGHDTIAAERDFVHRGDHREWGPSGLDRELVPSGQAGRMQDRFLNRLTPTAARRLVVLGSSEEKAKVKRALDEIIKEGLKK